MRLMFIRCAIGLLLSLVLGFTTLSFAAQPGDEGAVVVLTIDGPIGPATSDYVRRGLHNAQRDGARLVVLRIDTPGGLDLAMRSIIQAIIASPVPVASYVAPSGARAASAGTYILYASHIAAMAPATNLGAATPVQIGQPAGLPNPASPAGDNNNKESKPAAGKDGGAQPATVPAGGAMEHKIINDAAAYIRGLAQTRGRNADWAEKAVREAASLSAEEALKMHVIDLIAKNVPDLLRQLNGRTVDVLGQPRVLHTAGALVVQVAPDWRSRLLSVITDPNILPILMTIGVFGLLYEMLNPGFVLPGVLGGICLLLALYASQVLPVSFAGLALIGLGIVFMAGEAFMPSFGALGIGGVVAFVIGSIILIDTDAQGFGVSIPLMVSLGLVNAAVFIGVLTFALKARRRPVVSGVEEMVGMVGKIAAADGNQGWAWVHGERWQVRAAVPLAPGQKVRVTAIAGLILTVEAAQTTSENLS